jgi:NTE family protein
MTYFTRFLFLSGLSLQFLLLSGCASAPYSPKMPEKEPSTAYLYKVHPQVILVLGSGSARGFAHAGVLKTLEENHIPIDMIVGTSAGSIVGALYADKPSARALQHVLLNTPRNEVIDFSLMNITQGPISGAKLQKFLNNNLQAEDFEQLQIPFVAVTTDLDSGKIHVFGSGPIAPAVNASSAAPPFFRPVRLYGRTYIDGGLIDPVAVDVAQRFHPKLIIAVSLNYPLSKTLPTNSPAVFLRGFDMMLMQLNDYTAAKAQVIIRPAPGDINMFDGSQRAALIEAGEKAAEKALPQIKHLLAQNHIALAND